MYICIYVYMYIYIHIYICMYVVCVYIYVAGLFAGLEVRSSKFTGFTSTCFTSRARGMKFTTQFS
jgi:hypothetical protein